MIDSSLGLPGPDLVAALAGSGLALVLLALAVLARADRRWRIAALVCGVLGVALAEYALNEVRVQRMKNPVRGFAQPATIPRYTRELRAWAKVGMAALPLLAAAGARHLWTERERDLHDEATDHYKEGVHRYYQKDYEGALIELTAGLKIEPQRADFHCMRGAVFARLGAHAMALAELERALALAPAAVEPYLHRGRVYAAQGEYDLALSDFDRFLQHRHGDAECLLERAHCLEQKGAVAEAIATYEKVLRLTNHPDHALPATERLRALGASGPAWPQAGPSHA